MKLIKYILLICLLQGCAQESKQPKKSLDEKSFPNQWYKAYNTAVVEPASANVNACVQYTSEASCKSDTNCAWKWDPASKYTKQACLFSSTAKETVVPLVGSTGYYNLFNDIANNKCYNKLFPEKGIAWKGELYDDCAYPQYLTVDSIIRRYISVLGDENKRKLVMGVPFYGRAFRNVDAGSCSGGDYTGEGLNCHFSGVCSEDNYDCKYDKNGQIDTSSSATKYCYVWDCAAGKSTGACNSLSLKQCSTSGWMAQFYDKSSLAYDLYSKEPRFLLSKDLDHLKSKGFEYKFDNSALAPMLYNKEKGYWISYDDEISISHKTQYIKEQNLGGTMFWKIGDDCNSKSCPLAQKIAQVNKGQNVIGYYLVGTDLVEDIPWDNILSHLTHVNLSFFNIEQKDPCGEGQSSPYKLVVPSIIKNEVKKLNNFKLNLKAFYKSLSKYPNVKVVLSFGGWAFANQNAKYAYAYKNALKEDSRKSLVSSMDDLVKELQSYTDKFRYEGVDFDIEYIGQPYANKMCHDGELIDCWQAAHNNKQSNGLISLDSCKWDTDGKSGGEQDLIKDLTATIKEFKAKTPKLITSIAASGAMYSFKFLLDSKSTEGWKNFKDLVAELDHVNIMAYDYSGPWLQRGSYDKGNKSWAYGFSNCSFSANGYNFCKLDTVGGATAHQSPLYPSIKGVNLNN